MDNTNTPPPLSLSLVIKFDWKWWLSGAIFSFVLASILMSGWPSGLLPNLDYPFVNSGDGLSSSWGIKRLMEGWILDNPRTGYPFGSNFLDFPGADSGNYLILKLIGSITGEYYSAFNLYFLLGFSVTFAVSFCVLRTIPLSIPFAFTAATLFTFLPFHIQRIHHLYYTWYFVVPIFYYVALRLFYPSSINQIAEASLPWKIFFAICLIILGCFGVYYAIFGLIILAVISISAVITQRGISSLKFSFLAACFVALGVFLNLAPNIIYKHSNGPNPEVAQRSIAESEIYAFKFAQLVLPRQGHRNSRWAQIYHNYTSSTPLTNENGTATLGTVGALGLFAVFGVIFTSLVGRKPSSALRVVSLIVLVLFMFGTIGGFGVIFSQLISTSIRGWNRISVFISFGVLLVFFLLLQTQLQKYFTGRRLFSVSTVIAVIFLLGGLYDQTTPSCPSCNEQVKNSFNMDRNFIRSIENSLPKGSAIYQLPYLHFPEPSPPFYRMQPYDLMIGFLHSSSLHWSYGGMKGRTGDVFYRSLAKEPVIKQLDVIKRLGFAGVYVDKRGFEDNGAAIIDALSTQLGAPPILSRPDGNVVFFRLPQQNPIINLAGLNTEQLMQKADYLLNARTAH